VRSMLGNSEYVKAETRITTIFFTSFGTHHSEDQPLNILRRARHLAWPGFPSKGRVMSERNLHPNLAIFDDDARWTALPVFFVNEIMRLGEGIPASFFKFTWVILRYTLAPGKDGKWPYTCKTTQKQFAEEFHIHNRATEDWTRAYSVSGLFRIKKGKRYQKTLPGEPTFWQYNQKATLEDWQAFILALSDVLTGKITGGKSVKRSGKSKDGYEAAIGFAVSLAIAVDRRRASINGTGGPGLPPVNSKWIEQAIAQGWAKREKDGAILYSYVRPAWGFKEPVEHEVGDFE
jgi:hypothetical protein